MKNNGVVGVKSNKFKQSTKVTNDSSKKLNKSIEKYINEKINRTLNNQLMNISTNANNLTTNQDKSNSHIGSPKKVNIENYVTNKKNSQVDRRHHSMDLNSS